MESAYAGSSRTAQPMLAVDMCGTHFCYSVPMNARQFLRTTCFTFYIDACQAVQEHDETYITILVCYSNWSTYHDIWFNSWQPEDFDCRLCTCVDSNALICTRSVQITRALQQLGPCQRWTHCCSLAGDYLCLDSWVASWMGWQW